MKRTRRTFSLVGIVAIALSAAYSLNPESASSAYWRNCGSQHHDGAGWYHVKAHNVHCGKARAVARRYTHGLVYNPSPSPLGFSCQSRQTGYEVSHAACRRAAGQRVQKVRFIFGA